MNILPQTLLDGFVLGSVYTLVAMGFAIVFSIMKIANLAHGEIYMIGTYVAWMALLKVFHNWWIAMLLALVVGAILGIVAERLFRPVMKEDMFAQLLVGFGLSITLQEMMALFFGTHTKGIGNMYATVRELGPIRITDQRIIIVCVALLIAVAVFLFFKQHKLGKAMRAAVGDSFAASCCGIGSKRMAIYAFILGAAITTVGGSLMGPIYAVHPWIGRPILIIAIIVCVIGGMGSIEGAALAGYLIGIVDSLIKTYISTTWSYPMLYFVFFIFLLLRPMGLFGKERAG